jgi:branched-chain amino acid transport system permease protein
VRDNPERVEFIGYDTQWARYLTLILSAFFAGISGGLSAINFEIVTAENVSAARSSAILLFTFIGGIDFFFGPMIGALIGVFLTVMLSDFTMAWQLYLGIFFIVIVMYAPGGVASLIMMNLRLVKFGRFKRVLPSMLTTIGFALVGLSGAVMGIEMLYHTTLESAGDTTMKMFEVIVDTAGARPWLLVGILLIVGGLASWRAGRRLHAVWSEVSTEIEELIRRGA